MRPLLAGRMRARRAARVVVGVAAAIALAAACAPASAPAVERPRPETAAPPAPDPLAAPWLVEPARGAVTQSLRAEASLTSRVDTTTRLDTVRSELRVEWTRITGDGASRLSGLLTDFRVSVDTAPPVPPAGLSLPIPVVALDGVGAIAPRVSRPDPAGCGPDAAAAAGLRELLVTLPRRLEPGTTWSDSARYTVCRDSIPLAVETVRTFRALSAERRADGVVVMLERTSRVTMRGEGTQFGEAIAIEATGDGRARLVVQLAGGQVIEGDGESELRMTMRGRRRSQELTQRTRITIGAP